MISADGGGAAADLPVGGVEAEGAGKFVTAETGVDADVGIVEADAVGAEKRSERAVEKLRTAATSGLASDDDAGGRSEGGAEMSEFGVVELMKDQVGDEDGVIVVVAKCAEVGLMPASSGVKRVGARPEIDSVDGDAARFEEGGEFAGAGAEFEDAIVGLKK